MALCTVSGTVIDSSGTALAGIPVSFVTQVPILAAEPIEGTTSTATDGTWSLSVLQGLSGIFTISAPTSAISRAIQYKFSANIPLALTATFSSTLADS